MNDYERIQLETKLHCEALALWDGLFKHFSYLAFFEHPKLNRNSLMYLRHGVSKRIKTIWYDVRWITLVLDIKRKNPLTSDEINEANQHLNSIYLHTRGALDNLAWALLWQIDPSEAEQLEENEDYARVGLFSKLLKSRISGSELLKFLLAHDAWDGDFKKKRDPVAHRFPLYIIGQLLDEQEVIEFQKFNELISEAQKDLFDYCENAPKIDTRSLPIDKLVEAQNAHASKLDELGDKHKQLLDEQAAIGSFKPMFGFSMNKQDLMPIYPTITVDVGMLIDITTNVMEHLTQKLGKA